MIASYKEPVPGWVDNMNGPTGLMIGAGKGVIRSMLCNANYMSDIIPCDMAINATIALAWQVGTEKSTNPIFLNATANQENPISWGDALELGKKHVFENPFSRKEYYDTAHNNIAQKKCNIYLTCNIHFRTAMVSRWKNDLLQSFTLACRHILSNYTRLSIRQSTYCDWK